MNSLSEFISVEREYYDGEGINLFAFSQLGQASTYFDFVLIIAERHKVASQQLTANYELLYSNVSEGSGIMSDEQMALWLEGQKLSMLVHLEIETFYLFAKILLDKIASFIEHYFGQVRGRSLLSHDKLTKNFEQFSSAKGLICPKEFSESLAFLKENICDYRDKQISHLHNPRTIKGTAYSRLTGETRIIATQIYPNERELEQGQVESKELPELMQAIDLYTRQMIEFIISNRSRSKFKLKRTE